MRSLHLQTTPRTRANLKRSILLFDREHLRQQLLDQPPHRKCANGRPHRRARLRFKWSPRLRISRRNSTFEPAREDNPTDEERPTRPALCHTRYDYIIHNCTECAAKHGHSSLETPATAQKLGLEPLQIFLMHIRLGILTKNPCSTI